MGRNPSTCHHSVWNERPRGSAFLGSYSLCRKPHGNQRETELSLFEFQWNANRGGFCADISNLQRAKTTGQSGWWILLPSINFRVETVDEFLVLAHLCSESFGIVSALDVTSVNVQSEAFHIKTIGLYYFSQKRAIKSLSIINIPTFWTVNKLKSKQLYRISFALIRSKITSLLWNDTTLNLWQG